MLAALVALPASAQKITTQHEVVDCGQVKFRHPVTAEFVMKNEGNKPLVIHNMLKSCGCTEVEYPKKSIAAGESFVVKAVYDAKQMGTFNKQVCLYTNAADEPFILSMRGRVVSNVVDFAGPYNEMLGEIKSDVQEVEFDDVNRGDRPVQRIHIFNPTDQMMEPVVMHLPNYLQAQVSPSKVAPRHSAVVTLVLDSKKLRDLGLKQTSIYLGERPGDKIAPEKEIVVSSVLLPAFDNMTAAKKALAPKAELSTTNLDLGSFGNRKKLKGEVLITNKGKSKLEIRSMQMFTMGLQVQLKKSKIEPGETVKMKVTVVKPDLKKSRAKNPRILMITNDPDNAKVVVKIHVK